MEFDDAQICENGHVITARASFGSPDLRTAFCSKCGEATISKCSGCEVEIRGLDTESMEFEYALPDFCHSCGKPYPWTIKKSESLEDVIDQLEGIDEDEREKLKKTIPDLIRDTPKSESAALRFKRAIGKLSGSLQVILANAVEKAATKNVSDMMDL